MNEDIDPLNLAALCLLNDLIYGGFGFDSQSPRGKMMLAWYEDRMEVFRSTALPPPTCTVKPTKEQSTNAK